jgi:hypothetical protein
MNDGNLTPGESAVLVLDEAETLIWALLDDQLEDAETARLAKLLEDHEAVRRRYLDCVQLHVDLRDHFANAGVPRVETKGTSILPDLMPRGISSSESRVVE